MADTSLNIKFQPKIRRVMKRSLSVPRTKHELKQSRSTGFMLQRSKVNLHRLKRRDIMNGNDKSSSAHCTMIHTKNKILSRQKSKLIKKFQKCSKKIEDKFRKKYFTNNPNPQTSKNTNSETLSYNPQTIKVIEETDVILKKDDEDNQNTQTSDHKPIQLTIADVCFDFQNHGKCKRGESCRYQHVAASKSLCLDWKNGHCPRGDVCRFAHRYGSDIIQPKKHNHCHKNTVRTTLKMNHTNTSNSAHLAQIPSLVQNNILIKGITPWIQRGPLVIPTRNNRNNSRIQSALPKIIQTHNRFPRNMAPTRTPIAVILRDTNKNNHRMIRKPYKIQHRLTHPTFNRHQSNMPHLQNSRKSASLSPKPLMPRVSIVSTSNHSNDYTHKPQISNKNYVHPSNYIPFHSNHMYTKSPILPNDNNNNSNNTEEFDFEKLGDQIQSNIHSNNVNIRAIHRPQYKLAPHPPPPPPHVPYNGYEYKYNAPSPYFYPQERNYNNNINNNM